MQSSRFALLLGLLFAGTSAFAAGYEKSIPFGGRTAGVAGIATPYIQGSQAVFFNPAGLASDKTGQDVTLNISPIWTQVKGPIVGSDTQETSERQLITPGGLFWGWTPNDKWGVGAGFYVSGGSQAKYTDVAYTSPTGTAEVDTDLKIYELAIGGGYKVSDKLKVGLAWRAVRAEGGFSVFQRLSGTTAMNLKVEDLEDTKYNGFKVGAQYKVSDSTVLGLTYRNQVDFQAKGKFGGEVNASGTHLALDPNDVTAGTTFPQSVTLGVQHQCSDNWRGYAEVGWTQYSRVEHVTLDGNITRSGGTAVVPGDAPDMEQHWHDQYNVRLGSEYTGFAMPIRYGYMWTSQVTDDDYARASFVPPGNAHTLTLGSGKSFGDHLTFDFAADYTMVKGQGNGVGTLSGDYELTAYGAHLGLTYAF